MGGNYALEELGKKDLFMFRAAGMVISRASGGELSEETAEGEGRSLLTGIMNILGAGLARVLEKR